MVVRRPIVGYLWNVEAVTYGPISREMPLIGDLTYRYTASPHRLLPLIIAGFAFPDRVETTASLIGRQKGVAPIPRLLFVDHDSAPQGPLVMDRKTASLTHTLALPSLTPSLPSPRSPAFSSNP